MEEELYFSKVGEFSNLYLEKVLFEYEGEPIIFVCSNENTKFICNCYEFRYELKWILCETSDNILLDVINQEMTLRDTFLINNKKKFEIIIDERDNTIINDISDTEIDENILPTDNVLLRVNTPDLDAYVSQLKKK